MPSDLTLRVQSQDQGWQVLGVDRYRGVTPEGVKASANGWGSDLLNCALKRRPGAIFPDLATWTPCEMDVGGVTVWDGRIKEAVEQDGDSFQIGVVGAGWQYHLDDDTKDKVWVHSRLPDWTDVRANLTADLSAGGFTAAFQVAVGKGAVLISLPQGATSNANSARGGAQLDLGAGNTAVRFVMQFRGGGGAATRLQVQASDSPIGQGGTTETYAFGSPPVPTALTTWALTLTTPRRYLSIQFLNTGVAGTAGADNQWVRAESMIVFASTAYESGNASVLTTDTLVKDALTWAPLLSQDTSLIAAPVSGFHWPDAAPFDEKSAREIIEAFNVAEQMQPRVRIGKQLEYRAFPTAPLFEIGEWPGSEFNDQSSQSGQDVYNKVKVKGTGPDGSKLTVTRTQTGTIIDRFGFTRTKVLPVSMGLITALGNQLGDAFLSVHKTTPLKGDVTVRPGGVRSLPGGGSVHPSVLLLNTGEKLRLSHRVDPDTGGLGRDGQVAQVTYDHDTEGAQVSLDNQRDRFEGLLARLDAVIGTGS
jgi:hypothetical protein